MKYDINGYDSQGGHIVSLKASGHIKAIKKAVALIDLDDVITVIVVQKPDEKDPAAVESSIYSFARSADGAVIEYEGHGAEITTEPRVRRKVVDVFTIVLGGETYEASREDLRTIVEQAKQHGIRA